MRKVIYSMMVTVDGFIAGPDGGLDWGVIDEELHRFVNDQDRQMGGHLYGRRTYEVMADFWPGAADGAADGPAMPDYILDYARIWNNMPKVVFSRTLDKVGENAWLVREGIAEEVTRLKEQPGGDLAVAGANLAATFNRLGLIDEYQLYIHPVILGRGKPMFPDDGAPTNLRLLETKTFGSGVVYLHYGRAEAG